MSESECTLRTLLSKLFVVMQKMSNTLEDGGPPAKILSKWPYSVIYLILQLAMDQIQFAKVAYLVQRIMGASDASTSYSSSCEEKGWGSTVSACTPARRATTDWERPTWTDAQVSYFFNPCTHFCHKAIIRGRFLRGYAVKHSCIFTDVSRSSYNFFVKEGPS